MGVAELDTSRKIREFRPHIPCAALISDMDIREVVQAFTAMDAYGHPYAIQKGTMLSSVGDASGFNGRIADIETVASFVYFGVVYYARKDAIESSMKPMVFTARRERKVASV
jgi:hypothetical protein